MSLLPEVEAGMAVAQWPQFQAILIEDINTLLINSTRIAGNARILIHSNHVYCMMNEPLVTRLPDIAHGREIFAVSPTTHDVDLTIKFPTLNLQFQIIYDPGSDSCLFVNQSTVVIRLFRPGIPYAPIAVKEKEERSIQPGIWSVFAAHPGSDSYDVFKFLLTERLFNVSIFDGLQIEPECTTSSREIFHKAAVPLLDLKDGETAAVEALYNTGSETYRLQRIKQLSCTRNTSVFSCQHSRIPKEQSVVKVLAYNGMSALALPGIVGRWKTEKQLLGELKHVSTSYRHEIESFASNSF